MKQNTGEKLIAAGGIMIALLLEGLVVVILLKFVGAVLIA